MSVGHTGSASQQEMADPSWTLSRNLAKLGMYINVYSSYSVVLLFIITALKFSELEDN